jgi:tetratricopeptide (TPR) repeat protein
MKTRFLFILIILTSLLSCKTAGDLNPSDFQKAPILGMIYGFDNLPIDDAEIVLDDSVRVRTDIHGRFIIDKVARGDHHIVVTKEDYETIDITFVFSSRNQVLYLNMISFVSLLEEIESALLEGENEEAGLYLERAAKINAKDPRLLYLKGVTLTHQKRYEEAAEVISVLKEKYRTAPHIILFLSEIYDKGLVDREMAKLVLEEFLALLENEEVRNALKTLSETEEEIK